MIEIKKSYVVELTDEQARQLCLLLHSAEGFSYGERYCELRFLYDELQKLFGMGVR